MLVLATFGVVRINPDALKGFREARGLKTVELAKAVGVVPSHITNIEAGRREASPKLINALAEALRTSVLSLLGPDVRPSEKKDAA